MKKTVTAFLPCRSGSQRVKKKNTRRFSNIENGLIYLKLKQLIKSRSIDKIILSTNDEQVKNIAQMLLNDSGGKVVIDDRPDIYATSTASTDDLIQYASQLFKEEVVLWTHVTSPFIGSQLYDRIISKYFEEINTGYYDSLMTVTKIESFIWNDHAPINYDRNKEKWPRTQTLLPVYEVNSGVFLAHSEIYNNYSDRIGERPYYFELQHPQSIDIDTEEQYQMAERIWSDYEKEFMGN